MRNLVLVLLVPVLLCGCQNKEKKAELSSTKVSLQWRDYKTRPCQTGDLKGPYLSYRIDVFEKPTYQFWEDAHQLIVFKEDGGFQQISSSDQIVKAHYDETKKLKPTMEWHLKPESNIEFAHLVRPDLSHTMLCGILLESYPAEGHGFLPVTAGSLLLSYRCGDSKICQQHLFRKLLSEDELRQTYEHSDKPINQK